MNANRALQSLAIAAVCSVLTVAAVIAQYSSEPVTEPVAFEARWTTDQFDVPETWSIDGVDPSHGIDGKWLVEVTETSDPRMAGEIVYSFNDDHYRSIDLHLVHSSFRITNAEGAWQERPALLLGRPDLIPTTRTGVFVGNGAYDGLVAVAEISWDRTVPAWDVSGYIIDGDIPPLPGEGGRPE